MTARTLPLLLAVVLVGSACGLASTEINEIGLIYSGGITQDKEFKGILHPGSTSNSVGAGSEVYRYRTDQRSWIGGEQPGADTGPIVVVSADDTRMKVDFQLYFKLNIGEDVLKEFHENLGVKTQAWTTSGWTELLNTYFGPQVERAMETAALQHSWRDLYATEEARRAFQTDVVANLKRNIFEVIGGDYFCGPSYNGPGTDCGDFTFTVGKPVPVNDAIVAAIEAEQTATAQIAAQEAENLRIAAEIEGQRAQVELFGPAVYAYLKAVEAAMAVGQPPPPFFGQQPLPTIDAS